MKELITNILQAAAFFTMIFSAYIFLDSRHAPSEIALELELEMVEMDLKKDAEARAYYFDKQSVAGSLDGADKRRVENLENNLDRKYSKQKLIQARLLELKSE